MQRNKKHNNPYMPALVALSLARMQLAQLREEGVPEDSQATLDDLIEQITNFRAVVRYRREEHDNG